MEFQIRSWGALGLACLLWTGCSGNEPSTEDMGTQVPVDLGMADAGAEPDLGPPDLGPNDTGVSCDRDGFEAVRELVVWTENAGTQYIALSSEQAPFDRIAVIARRNGVTPPPAQVYNLEGTNLSDCTMCVLAFSNCNSDNVCEKIYYADQGEVDVAAIGEVGGRFTATIRNAIFTEVTIDSGASTPVADGETWCLAERGFDLEIEDPTAVPCGREDVTCIGETVPNFMLQNCATGEFENFYDIVDGRTAAWVVGTAGWCPACRQFLPQVVDVENSVSFGRLKVLYVLGEDSNYNMPTLEYCRQYAASYTDADRFYLDHNFRTIFDNLWPYTAPDGSFGTPWNALIDPATFEYRYADRSGQPETLSEALNAILSGQ